MTNIEGEESLPTTNIEGEESVLKTSIEGEESLLQACWSEVATPNTSLR